MNHESAIKTLNHIQKVFYVVGAINIFFIISNLRIIGIGFVSIFLIINLFFAFFIIFMGWALNKSYRRKIPKAAFILSCILVGLALIEYIFVKNISLAGLVFPIALWRISKQAQDAIAILDNTNDMPPIDQPLK